MPNVSEVVEMESEQIEIKTENMEMDADIRLAEMISTNKINPLTPTSNV